MNMDKKKSLMKKSVINKNSILRPAEEVKCNFLFDIIVPNFDTPLLSTLDKNKISFNVQFNRNFIEISESCINVSEFQHGTGAEFQVSPEELRQSLEDCGMAVSVKYDGRVIGNGQMFFPKSFTESIMEDMSDLMHEDTCTFEKKGEILGTIQFLCRLIIKCEDKPNGQTDCRRNMGSCISSQDILFLISESQRCPQSCDPCSDAWEPEEGDERLSLDLQRYRNFNTEALRPVETLKHFPACDAITCELKQMAKECEETMDVILKSTGHRKPPCRSADALRGTCDRPCLNEEEIPELTLTQAPGMPANLGQVQTTCFTPKMQVSVSDKNKSDIKPTRFCPGCLANMSWLPKFAACPKCGLKPIPVADEINRSSRLIAEQILLDYLENPKSTMEDYCKIPCDKAAETKNTKDEGQLSECRCTCKYGKICASCRVRKQCAEYIDKGQMKRVPQEPLKKPKSSEDFCFADVKPKDSRPFLSRVFSELRIMYDIKDTVQPAKLDKQSDRQEKKSPKMQLPFGKGENASTVKKQTEPKNRVMVEHNSKKPRRLISPMNKISTRKPAMISRRHGWAWTSTREARKYGWRPGAIFKPIKKIMRYFREHSPETSPLGICKKEIEKEEQKERQLPILNICKRNGEIFLTLRAINTDKIKMKPIVFKIVKSDLAVIMSQIKRKLKDRGFPKCTCHRTLMMCICRDHEEKKNLEYALQKECKRRGMESCVDQLILTDTSESDIEFDFDVTPPAGVAKPEISVKPHINHSTQTQMGKKDLKIESKYPIKNSFYHRTYDCATGDRYAGTAFGKPGEVVREDGLFGYRHGGPHGESTYPGDRPKSRVIWGTKSGGPMHGGGRFGQQSTPGGKSFPGGKEKRKSGNNAPIPVRMPKRYYIAAEKAARAAKQAAEHAKKKKPANMMEYMMKKGAVSVPWSPNANAY